MASLNGQTIASSYEQLLHTDTDGGGNGNTLVSIKDGDNGTTFGLKLATNKVEVIPSASDDANAFEVSQADGTAVFTVNSSTPGVTLTGTLGVTGNSTLTGDVSIVSASSASPTLIVKNTNNDGEPAFMQFIKDTSNSAADNDEIVKMEFYHDNDANSLIRYGSMIVSTTDVSNGSEDSNIRFNTRLNGADTITLTLSSGDVGIGTTSPRISTAYGSTNSKYLTVTNGSTGPGILTLSADRTGTGQGVGRIEFTNANNADASNNDADGKTIASVTTNLITSDSNAHDDSGGEILFSTKPEAGSLAERLKIDENGFVIINQNDSGSAGSNLKQLSLGTSDNT